MSTEPTPAPTETDLLANLVHRIRDGLEQIEVPTASFERLTAMLDDIDATLTTLKEPAR